MRRKKMQKVSLPVLLPGLSLDHAVLGLSADLLPVAGALGFLGLGLRLEVAPVADALVSPDNNVSLGAHDGRGAHLLSSVQFLSNSA